MWIGVQAKASKEQHLAAPFSDRWRAIARKCFRQKWLQKPSGWPGGLPPSLLLPPGGSCWHSEYQSTLSPKSSLSPIQQSLTSPQGHTGSWNPWCWGWRDHFNVAFFTQWSKSRALERLSGLSTDKEPKSRSRTELESQVWEWLVGIHICIYNFTTQYH